MPFVSIEQYLDSWYGEVPDPEQCMPSDYYGEKMGAFRAERNRPGCIVMLGDSLTDFAGDWREYLPGWDVVNRGIAGDMIEGMELRLKEVASLQPSQLYVLAGCNNFVKHPWAQAEDIWPVYEHFLKQIKATLPEVPLHIISLLPMHPSSPDYPGFNAKAARINAILKKASDGYGYQYLDLAARLKDENGDLRREYTLDGCHLTDEGFRIWADLMKNKSDRR